jgi:hypothetical protein
MNRRGLVFSVCALFFAAAYAQIATKRTVSKGPRAVGVLQIAENGRARLLPVSIMLNGEFYDAGAYKADPVPMALQSGVVYEAEKAGVPQGLFTVGGAAQLNGNWFADGKWQTEAEIAAEKDKRQADIAKKNQVAPPTDEIGGPPRLKRGGESASSSTPSSPQQQPSSQGPPVLKRPQTSEPEKPSAENSAKSSASIDAPDRPILRRQPMSEVAHEQTKASPETAPLNGPLHFVAAVSDADGPEARPYTFALKPEEEQGFLKKVEAMAAEELRLHSASLSVPDGAPAATSASPRAAKATGKSSRPAPKPAVEQPRFQDTQMRAFDISNSNEGLLVFTATATLPQSDLQYMVAVVAREDIYGDLHKVFAQTTDSKHLDVEPRYDFIDVIDADGDGRGELLFRRSWDSGSAFSVYRVIGDRLWPLFEGKPGS